MVLFECDPRKYWTNAVIDDGSVFHSPEESECLISFDNTNCYMLESSDNLFFDIQISGRFYLKVIFTPGVSDFSFPIEIFKSKNGGYVIPCALFNRRGLFTKIQIVFSGKLHFRSISLTSQLPYFECKIMMHSGIGDCVRAISRHDTLGQIFSVSSGAVYWAYGGNGTQSSGWEGLLNEYFFGRNKNFKNISAVEFNDLPCPELFNGYSGRANLKSNMPFAKQGFDISLSIEEEQVIFNLLRGAEFRVALQIKGNDPKKCYPQDKLKILIDGILSKRPNARIYLLDSPNTFVEDYLYSDSRVINCIGVTNISQNINIILNCDVLIAPDSFSKYVAGWADIHQVILCAHLTYIEPSNMLRHAFDVVGLYNNPRVKLLGINHDGDFNVSSCCDDVAKIDVAEILSFVC